MNTPRNPETVAAARADLALAEAAQTWLERQARRVNTSAADWFELASDAFYREDKLRSEGKTGAADLQHKRANRYYKWGNADLKDQAHLVALAKQAKDEAADLAAALELSDALAARS